MNSTAPTASGKWNQDRCAPWRDGDRSRLRPARALRARSGFTMIELLVAITVLLISLAAAFGSQVVSFGLIDSSRDSTLAMTELERCMEEVLTKSSDNIPVDYPAGEPIPGYDDVRLRQQSIVPSFSGYSGSGAIPDPLEVALEATWLDSRGRLQRLNLTTQVAR
ncbi:type II secretion system GspH family protein [bacterium]|mgnify:CR=1 FL=1|nr:type II secretion system GspH family protein [bacterium]